LRLNSLVLTATDNALPEPKMFCGDIDADSTMPSALE